MREIKDIFIEFHQRMDKFLRSGYNSSLDNISRKIKELFGDVDPMKKKCVAEILKTQISLIQECTLKIWIM